MRPVSVFLSSPQKATAFTAGENTILSRAMTHCDPNHRPILEHQAVGDVDSEREAWIFRFGVRRVRGLDPENGGLPPLEEDPATDPILESERRTVGG